MAHSHLQCAANCFAADAGRHRWRRVRRQRQHLPDELHRLPVQGVDRPGHGQLQHQQWHRYRGRGRLCARSRHADVHPRPDLEDRQRHGQRRLTRRARRTVHPDAVVAGQRHHRRRRGHRHHPQRRRRSDADRPTRGVHLGPGGLRGSRRAQPFHVHGDAEQSVDADRDRAVRHLQRHRDRRCRLQRHDGHHHVRSWGDVAIGARGRHRRRHSRAERDVLRDPVEPRRRDDRRRLRDRNHHRRRHGRRAGRRWHQLRQSRRPALGGGLFRSVRRHGALAGARPGGLRPAAWNLAADPRLLAGDGRRQAGMGRAVRAGAGLDPRTGAGDQQVHRRLPGRRR